MGEEFEAIEALYETDSSAGAVAEGAHHGDAPRAVPDDGPGDEAQDGSKTGATAEAQRRATLEAIIASGAVW